MLTKCSENIRLAGQSLIILLAIAGSSAFFTPGALSKKPESQAVFTSEARCVRLLWGELFGAAHGFILNDAPVVQTPPPSPQTAAQLFMQTLLYLKIKTTGRSAL